MKEIGRTRTGSYLVEMSEAQQRKGALLQAAMDKLEHDQALIMRDRRLMDGDIEPALVAVLHWVQAKFNLNAIRNLLSGIEQSFGEGKQ